MQKVNLAIVGFQKCATTSIKNYLREHPAIIGHAQKEMTFFAIEEEYNKGIKEAFKRYYPNVSAKTEYKYILAKHATLIRHEESIKRLYEHNSEARVIVCLRDPVARAFSSYLMEVSNGVKLPNFIRVVKDAFASEAQGKSNWHYNVFIQLGQYIDYIEILLKYFKRNQIYYCNIEEFKENPANGVTSILQWLQVKNNNVINYERKHNDIRGIRYEWLSSINKMVLRDGSILKKIAKHLIPLHKQSVVGDLIRKLNKKTIVKPVLSKEAQALLERHYQTYNEKLYMLTGVEIFKGRF